MQSTDLKGKIILGIRQNSKHKWRAFVDAEGRIVLPPEMGWYYGLRPGVDLILEEVRHGLKIRPPASYLAKVYIEPTNRCNLECRTCIRRRWDEPLGDMENQVFARIIEGLKSFSPVPMVFFGGFGEPLAHPQIIEMIAQAKAIGAWVELITNGTMLTRSMAKELIRHGLRKLWVSIDGAKPESYADVRLGAALPQVIKNIMNFREECHLAPPPRPELGIVFVAMKRNIADLPEVLNLGTKLGANDFLVTNVLAYTPELKEEILYMRALGDFAWGGVLRLPKMDLNEETRDPFYWVMRSGKNVSFPGDQLGETNDYCPFIESGSTSISWQGDVSPCLPLMHSHKHFIDDRERFSRKYVVGNLREHDLLTLWNDPEYVALRERLKNFDFSPCTICGGCELFEKNEEDCFGNKFPTCGGCLWAQGIIRCP